VLDKKFIVKKKTQTMQNIVGQTPRGSDFFPRNTIVERIYCRLESGYMLNKIEWLMPFFILLVIQMVIDESELNTQQPVPKELIDKVLSKASNHRNKIYFENYYSRLDKTLPPEESLTAKEILAEVARKGAVPVGDFTQTNTPSVLEILEFDGYIHLDESKTCRFNSPILRMWWEKFAR